jgi:hypothetical protein
MPAQYSPGDFLVFQLESGFGVIRILGIDELSDGTVWHLMVFEDFFPDVQSAEEALVSASSMRPRLPHIAITDRAFERSPAAKVGSSPLTEDEINRHRDWLLKGAPVSDRSVFQMLGMR